MDHKPLPSAPGLVLDPEILEAIKGFAGDLIQYEDTHAWLASEDGEADLHIYRE